MGSGGVEGAQKNWNVGMVGVRNDRNKVAKVPGNSKCWVLLAKGVVPAGC